VLEDKDNLLYHCNCTLENNDPTITDAHLSLEKKNPISLKIKSLHVIKGYA
jgi:hypothetical protein